MRIDEFAVGSRSQFRMRNACFRESFADWSGGMKLSLIREDVADSLDMRYRWSRLMLSARKVGS